MYAFGIFMLMLGAFIGIGVTACLSNSKIADLESENCFLKKQNKILKDKLNNLENIV